MATEYKLSYTASEINAKLGKVDNMITTINGMSPDENGNVAINGDTIITKSNVESVLTGNVTTHTHNQYLTSHQDISGKLDKSGGTMTGALTLASDPTSNLHAATKQYVDANKGGSGTITGVSANGTSVATSGVANIPAASTSAYGVTKLSSSTSSTSTSLAATASAVKSAYDLANTANTAASNASTTANNAMPKAGGTFTGAVTAQNNTSYTTKQVRNVFLIADGASLPSGTNGDICLVYTP